MYMNFDKEPWKKGHFIKKLQKRQISWNDSEKNAFYPRLMRVINDINEIPIEQFSDKISKINKDNSYIFVYYCLFLSIVYLF